MPGGPMNLLWMAVPVVVMAWFAWSAMREENRPSFDGMLFMSAALGLGFILDGWYWAIFPRGTGFFTANRVSAFAVFFLLIAVPYVLVRRRDRREWRKRMRAELDRNAMVENAMVEKVRRDLQRLTSNDRPPV